MSEIYPIVPAGPRPFYLLVPVILLLVGVLFLLFRTVYGSQRAAVHLTRDTLSFHGDLYGRPLPLEAVRRDQARIISLADQPSLRPVGRRLGTGLPGYLSGWVNLQSGEKALVFLTTRDRVIYLPTTRGYSVLLSLRDPDRFLARIRPSS